MNRQLQQDIYEALMMEYVAGTLDRAQNMIIATHLSLSPMAYSLVREMESIAGALMERYCEPVAMDPSSLERTLARLEQEERIERKTQRPQRLFPEDLTLPELVRQAVLQSGPPKRPVEWRVINADVRAVRLPVPCRRSRTEVYKISPGRSAPQHSCKGIELTLVLDGSFADETGEYTIGDLLINAPETPEHQPQACHKHGCVYINVTPGNRQLPDPLAHLLDMFFRS